MEDIPKPSCGSYELSSSGNKRGSNDQVEQTSASNRTKAAPVDTQMELYLPHVSVSDIMPVPKADISVQRKGQNRSKTATVTSFPYSDELKDKINPISDPTRPILSNRLLGKVDRNQRTD
jgi:hypothetical protein